MTDIRSRLEALTAQPRTHRVTTTFSSGKVRTYDAISEGSAKAFAERESRSIGRACVSRETSEVHHIVSVEVAAIQ